MGTSKKRERSRFTRGRARAKRPRTFTSEEAAKKYADANKIKDYKLVNLRCSTSKTKKIRIEAN